MNNLTETQKFKALKISKVYFEMMYLGYLNDGKKL